MSIGSLDKELLDGLWYHGVKKQYCGMILLNPKQPFPNMKDVCGYYYWNGKYIVFITDSEKGIGIFNKKCDFVKDAIQELCNIKDREDYIYLKETTIDNFWNNDGMLREWLEKEYSYNETQIKQAIEYLQKEEDVLFELLYYIKNKKYVPDKYAVWVKGYTCENIYNMCKSRMSILGAFNYMVFLKKNPERAIKILSEHLPQK